MPRIPPALFVALIAVSGSLSTHAGILKRGQVQLLCHRTANRDVPENTLESLAYAARMGCNVVELDIRTTLDGQLVLNHDGYLERLTNGMGDVSGTSFDELEMLDTGGWMAPRFSPMRIPRFEDALRLARSLNLALDLDIKQPGEGAAIFGALQREGMTDRVIFGGDDGFADDLAALMPATTKDPTTWFGPLVTAAQVAAAHAEGRFVVANFSANPHEMDLPAMRAAVKAGVDAINVDYPRLGADAVGRPVELALHALAQQALQGGSRSRTAAIRELSVYTGFPIGPLLLHLLHDPDAEVSHAAALALLRTYPATPASTFVDDLQAPELSARTNAAWALGMMQADAAPSLLPLLRETDPVALKEILLAISRCRGEVPTEALLPFFDSLVPTVRGAAALALAAHQPKAAATAIPALLVRDEKRSAADYQLYVQRGKPKLTQPEIDVIIEEYREHMKLIHALEMLPPITALPLIATEAARVAEDPSHVTSVLAGYGLWDLIAVDPTLPIGALQSASIEVGDRAEWALIKSGPGVLPQIRAALASASPAERPRLIHILAWGGDTGALPQLTGLLQSDPADRDLLQWAIDKIHSLQLIGETKQW